MGLLSGSVACTRFNVVAMPDEVDFEAVPFRAIQPGSRIRESMGFVPFEIEEPFRIGDRQWAFRVRIDRVQPDRTRLNERIRELIKLERDQFGPPSPKKLKSIKRLAEDESVESQSPRTRIIEGFIDDFIVYVGSTAKSYLGSVSALLKKVGIELEFKTPWLDAGQDEDAPEWLDLKSPAQSVLGARFLASMLRDPEMFVEGVNGHVKLITQEGSKVTLTGAVTPEMERYLDDRASFTSAKFTLEGATFTLDALAYRINGLKIKSFKADHWSTALEARMDIIKDIWELLDERYKKARL